MKRLALLALVGALPAGGLLAQTANEAIIDRVQQPGTPPASPAPTAATGEKETGDLDGGVQRIAEARARPFKLTLGYDVQAFYTSNVFLQPEDSSEGDIESLIVANTLQARADFDSVAIGETLLSPSAALVYQRYNHAIGTGDEDREDLDFDAYTLPLNARLRFGDNWELNAGLTGTLVYSLEGPPRYNLTYSAVTPSLNLQKRVGLAPNHILTFGATVSYAFTEAESPFGASFYRDDRNDKADYALDAAYYYVNKRWVAGAYTRLALADYTHYQEASIPPDVEDVDRADIVGSIGAVANYTLNRWASARVFTSYDWRNPQKDNPNDTYGYKNANLGVGLSLTASF